MKELLNDRFFLGGLFLLIGMILAWIFDAMFKSKKSSGVTELDLENNALETLRKIFWNVDVPDSDFGRQAEELRAQSRTLANLMQKNRKSIKKWNPSG